MYSGMQRFAHSQGHPSAELCLFALRWRKRFTFFREHFLKSSYGFNNTFVRLGVSVAENRNTCSRRQLVHVAARGHPACDRPLPSLNPARAPALDLRSASIRTFSFHIERAPKTLSRWHFK